MVITREQINKVLEENKARKIITPVFRPFSMDRQAQMLFTIAGSSLYMISRTIRLSALSNQRTGQIMKTIAQPVEMWLTR